MLSDFVEHIASHAGISICQARVCLGVILNASERANAELSRELFERVPGARTLSARTGAEIGAATGELARLIEQTPGGRVAVAQDMIQSLQDQGLSNSEIGALFPAIESFVESEFGVRGVGQLGAVLGRADIADVCVGIA